MTLVFTVDDVKNDVSLYSQGPKVFPQNQFPIDFSVFSCSLEIILRNYCSTDCNNFGTGSKLYELYKQYICFISVVHRLPK